MTTVPAVKVIDDKLSPMSALANRCLGTAATNRKPPPDAGNALYAHGLRIKNPNRAR